MPMVIMEIMGPSGTPGHLFHLKMEKTMGVQELTSNRLIGCIYDCSATAGSQLTRTVAAGGKRSVQTSARALVIQIGRWLFLSLGVVGALIAFVALFLVPGAVDLNRIIVVCLFASLAANSLLLSALFFWEAAESSFETIRSIVRTPPAIILSLFLATLMITIAAIPWWARR